MPSISQSIVIAGTQYDRRIKISEDVKEQVLILRNKHYFSYAKIAEKCGISKDSARMICHPEFRKQSNEAYKQRAADGRYHKDHKRAADIQREHRQYKQGLYLQNKI